VKAVNVKDKKTGGGGILSSKKRGEGRERSDAEQSLT